MGEIEVNRLEYLYDLTFSDLLMIERGYFRRSREMWSMIRWQTFHTMTAFCGGDNMKKSGIMSPRDLITFPWESTLSIPYTEEEQKQLQAEMDFFMSQRK